MELTKALPIAQEIVKRLSPYCLPGKCIIAGSIRREKEQVGDIEIVAQYQPREILYFYQEVSKIIGVRSLNGNRFIQGIIKLPNFQIDELQLDLFIPQPNDFYRQLAIRTGSKDYSFKVIATAWVKMGWCGTKVGLRLQSECTKFKARWSCTSKTPTLPPVWQSEKEFFQWLNIPYIHPNKRNA